MKTCDVCRRTDRNEALPEGGIHSFFIGATSGANSSHECPVECELCEDCLRSVNETIAELMRNTFGVVIRN